MIKLNQVSIKGIASAVPKDFRTRQDDEAKFGPEIAKISKTTGVDKRYIASETQCTSDLCYLAAKTLLSYFDWSQSSIDALILVTQTPDYILPATSCVLHGHLNLKKSCATFDINLGCSGYVYGLWLAATIISSGSFNRVLLLTGDTISRIISPLDQTVVPLFGDAGTATIIEKSVDINAHMFFSLGTDGAGRKHLIVPAGGFRHPKTQQTAERYKREDFNIRSDEDLYMNGPEIFSFTLREIPKIIEKTLEDAGWQINDVDAFVFHQANEFMLNHLKRRLKIPDEKFISILSNYGNTSSASIPLAITHNFINKGKNERLKLILCGFGVGYSWGAVAINCNANILLAPLALLH